LIVLRIFEPAFYNVGIVFVAFGALMLVIAAWRRRKNNDIFDADALFETGGGFVVLTSLLAFATYATLLVLILKLDRWRMRVGRDEEREMTHAVEHSVRLLILWLSILKLFMQVREAFQVIVYFYSPFLQNYVSACDLLLHLWQRHKK
jgi:hypothetical protein